MEKRDGSAQSVEMRSRREFKCALTDGGIASFYFSKLCTVMAPAKQALRDRKAT
jgi:hypothetical protein